MHVRQRGFQVIVTLLVMATIVATGTTTSLGAKPRATKGKKVLVELYTSQGCNMCPAADRLLDRLDSLGYGPDRIVRLSFHVDYFNDPWKDPFSDLAYSQREMAYNGALGRKDLYFTPMMMIDGRHPMLGSDQPKAQAALDRSLKERPGVTLALDLASSGSNGDKGDALRKSLEVTVTPQAAEAVGRDLLVGVALYENPVSTVVPSGENAGKTLVEHYTVRKFVYQKVQLTRAGPKQLSFDLELPSDVKPRQCGVAVFVQDWLKGGIHQADALAWTRVAEEPGAAATTSRP